MRTKDEELLEVDGHTSDFADSEEEIRTIANPDLPSPISVKVKSPKKVIKKCADKIASSLDQEWQRDEEYRGYTFNGDGSYSRSRSLNGSDEDLNLREIKEIVRPYVENDWYVEIQYRCKPKLSWPNNRRYHATRDFLDDSTNDQYKGKVQVYFNRVDPNQGYISRSIISWPISIVLLTVAAIAGTMAGPEAVGMIAIAVISTLLSLVSLLWTTRHRIRIRSAEPGRCGTLVHEFPNPLE
tara:strand:- start:8388 stop:9107 length:720 start_codon:yes stop_codon:yes gene_type:complete